MAIPPVRLDPWQNITAVKWGKMGGRAIEVRVDYGAPMFEGRTFDTVIQLISPDVLEPLWISHMSGFPELSPNPPTYRGSFYAARPEGGTYWGWRGSGHALAHHYAVFDPDDDKERLAVSDGALIKVFAVSRGMGLPGSAAIRVRTCRMPHGYNQIVSEVYYPLGQTGYQYDVPAVSGYHQRLIADLRSAVTPPTVATELNVAAVARDDPEHGQIADFGVLNINARTGKFAVAPFVEE